MSTNPIKIKPERFYDPRELAMGVEHEMEHTTNRREASATTRQHLEQIKDYYTRLDKMEARAKRGLAPNPASPIAKRMAETMALSELQNTASRIESARQSAYRHDRGVELPQLDREFDQVQEAIALKRGLAPNPSDAFYMPDVVSTSAVKWSGQPMRSYDLNNGAHIIGLQTGAGATKQGFQLHVLDVDEGSQRGGIGEAAVIWLKYSFGPVDVIDPVPEALGFWRKMKKRGYVRAIAYSEGAPGDASNNPAPMYTYYGREVSKADYETFKRAEAAGMCPFCEQPLNRRYGAHRKHMVACSRKLRGIAR